MLVKCFDNADLSLRAKFGNPYLKIASVNEIPEDGINLLSQYERQRYHRYKNKNAADLFMLGRILLRKILSENYSLPFDTGIEIDTNGKPYIPHSSLYFNISHSNERAVVVFAEKPVGVDIEKLVEHAGETLLAMGKKVFSSKEMLLLENAANIQECFTKMWTIKESFVKMAGAGLAYSSEIDISAIDTSDKYKCFTERTSDDYFLSVTVKL
ncbi:MAG: 4'-phosphopantetheinyl transferase superfamily protein [Bacteroidales bacterium]|jgi:4'-phosphopantetheinyl transferase|nr:4'-phosphopantetheinyl transferase superfamily protein [Bacteroidales bacterium]